MDQNLMQNLNKEQLEAVLHKSGPLLIVAGAGTGKTTVITQKIAYIIEQDWAKSDEILALTFTEKAAGEMEDRVSTLLPIGYFDLWISTFHSFGEKILKAHGIEIGLPDDFKLLNEFEQYILVKKNLDKFDLDYYRPLGNPTKFIRALIKHFSRLKDEDISPKDYLKYAEELKDNLDNRLGGDKKVKKQKIKNIAENEIETQEISRINEIANAYHVYQKLLLDNSALDFGDLINFCLKLFRDRPAILKKYQEQFKYILVDEFQDTNWAQYELIKMLAGPKSNLTVVGDDDQSIYKFRGASVSNILQFEKDYKGAHQIFLTNNYRNKQNILDQSYEFISLNNPNRLEYQLQKNQKTTDKKAKNQKFSKKLIANSKGEGTIEVLQGNDLDEEIKLITEKIIELKNNDKEASWNDFAILVRANESAKEICAALDSAGLPYQFMSSRGLYAKPVILDIISFLKLLDDYHESIAMYRVLNMPVFKFTSKEISDFNYWAGRKTYSLFEILHHSSGMNFGVETNQKISNVLNIIEKHTAMAREKSVSEIILSFLEASGYEKYILGKGEAFAREITLYINQFLKRVKKFEANGDISVKAFLNELDMEIDAGEEGGLPVDFDSGPETIRVLTVHAAKGLEFKYVFIANMVDLRFPTIERSDPIEIPDALVKEILPEGDIHLEEERRLFYVAMTRAKQGLYFSWAPDYGGSRMKKPSRFLAECGLVSMNKMQSGKAKLSDEKKNELMVYKKSELVKTETQRPAMPAYFSFTQLEAFSNCPQQYLYAHILRIPRKGKAQFSFGKTMHSVLQKTFSILAERSGFNQLGLFDNPINKKEKIKITLDEMLKAFDECWIDEWYENKKQKEEYRKKGREIIKVFFEKHKNEWPNAVFLEKSFNAKVKAGNEFYTIRGTMDRVDEKNNKLRIVDYKTGAPKKKLDFNEKKQLLLYQMAAKDLFNKEIESLAFYYLEDNSEFEFLGSPEELQKLRDNIEENITEIKKGEFPANPSQLCKFCDFFDICENRKV